MSVDVHDSPYPQEKQISRLPQKGLKGHKMDTMIMNTQKDYDETMYFFSGYDSVYEARPAEDRPVDHDEDRPVDHDCDIQSISPL